MLPVIGMHMVCDDRAGRLQWEQAWSAVTRDLPELGQSQACEESVD